MLFHAAKDTDFERIRQFYWNMIEQTQDQRSSIGWEKGVYPTDEFLKESLRQGELYVLSDEERLCACVVLNNRGNEGYKGVPWSVECPDMEVIIPHALAVSPEIQGRGIGKILVKDIIDLAKASGKKALRLDILGTNQRAEHLYRKMGFCFVQAKDMFYEDTGWAEYKMYELNL